MCHVSWSPVLSDQFSVKSDAIQPFVALWRLQLVIIGYNWKCVLSHQVCDVGQVDGNNTNKTHTACNSHRNNVMRGDYDVTYFVLFCLFIYCETQTYWRLL